jgi:antitoxin MazE
VRIETNIQKWGNGLALRVSGIMRDIPHFAEGTKVVVDVTEDGFTVKKLEPQHKKKLQFSEKELLNGLTRFSIHADEIAILRPDELGDE